MCRRDGETWRRIVACGGEQVENGWAIWVSGSDREARTLTPGAGTVIPVTDRFSGKLTLPEQEVVAVDLEISPDTLTLRADNVLIGTWPIKFCRVSKINASVYQLSVDGEIVSFEPDDDRQFAVVAAQRFRASSLADRINVVRSVEPPDLEATETVDSPKRKRLDISLLTSPIFGWGVAGLAALIVVVWGVTALFGSSDPPEPPPVSIAVTPPSSGETLVGAFEMDPSLFVVRWNTVAREFGVPELSIRSALPRGSFETLLAPLVTLQGATDDEGEIRSFVVVADPTGDAESDQLAIAAWGIALTVADPTLDESGRSQVLAEMGIDVRSPQLGGLDADTELNGVRYVMQYYEAFNSVLLNISEAR